MTLTVSVQLIESATCNTVENGDAPFDVVRIRDDLGASVNLYLPAGKGKAVADAINAAIFVEVTE
jgi:hypothetical protein